MSDSDNQEKDESFKYVGASRIEVLRELHLKFADQIAAYPLLLPAANSDRFLCHVKIVIGDSESEENILDSSMPMEVAFSAVSALSQLLASHINMLRRKGIKLDLALSDQASLVQRAAIGQNAFLQMAEDIPSVFFDQEEVG